MIQNCNGAAQGFSCIFIGGLKNKPIHFITLKKCKIYITSVFVFEIKLFKKIKI